MQIYIVEQKYLPKLYMFLGQGSFGEGGLLFFKKYFNDSVFIIY